MGLSRRRLLAVLFGLPLVGGAAALAWRRFAALQSRRFDGHAERTVAAIVDRLIPADDLPGAVALKIDQRIATEPDMQQSLADGVNWLDAHARRAGAADFLGLDEAGQLAAITAGWAAYDTAVEQMLSSLWYRTATLYYSEAVVQQAYAYAGAPQPIGFPDYRQAPR